MKYEYLIFIVFLLFPLNKIFSSSNSHESFYNQVQKTIQIIHADFIQNDDHNKTFVLTGNVHLKYDKYHLFCDKIIYYKKYNKFHGCGNIRLEFKKNKIISQNIVGNFFDFKLSGKVILYQDKIKLTSDIINFNFKKKLFQAINNVVLFLDKIKLTTGVLEYNFTGDRIFYKKNGIIHYGDYTVSSKEGFLYIKNKKIELKRNIKLISQNYIVYANTLEYLFKQNQVNFHNTVIVVQKKNFDNFIYAQKALFSFQKKIFLFKNYVSIHYDNIIVRGKYLFFDQKKKCGFIQKILLKDSTKKYFLISEYGKFDFDSGSLILNKNPKVIKMLKNDSVVIYSNIFKINVKKNFSYLIQAFSVNIFFLNQLIQGKCDLFNYASSNNYTQFDGNPIFWFYNQKITGKTIHVHFQNENDGFLKYIKIIKNAFYTEKINSEEFNQVEGNTMTGFFDKKNYLEKVIIQGNVNALFFFYPDKERKIIHRSFCEILSIYLDQSKKIIKISCKNEAYSKFIPIDKNTPKEDFYLPQFSWKDQNIPIKNKKIFIHQEIDQYKKEIFLEKEDMKIMIKK
ncbi:OstA-like protein [Blattabacterium cuenoti]|uniref:OstA-like protein n=1 Tax=Blattabacterium cuenoti TaxID=1653831 RepID=UPI001EEC84AA|nr:OstA-like protein [Blattabacterium cuenoti]